MTAEGTGTRLSTEASAWLAVWEKCTQEVLSEIIGQPVTFDASAEALAITESDVWFTVVVGGALRGEMTLRVPVTTGVLLAQKLLQETGPPPAEPTADHKDALEELLRQVAGQAATALVSVAGGEVQLHVAASGAPSWAASGIKHLHTRDEAANPIDIEVQVSAALAAALPTPTAAPVSAPAAPAPPPAAAASAPPAIARYERLRDVILEVKLRFGSRRMVLRDVLALSAGVVVELDSNVSSPVDLLLDGRVVAQGEVVVVDGKYGLRVTQVVDARSSS